MREDEQPVVGAQYLRLDGIWMHVGTPEALAEAETNFEHEGA